MKDIEEIISMMQQSVTSAAESKFGRALTDAERAGIASIKSMAMLESCERSFSSPGYTIEQSIADLEYFAREAEEA